MLKFKQLKWKKEKIYITIPNNYISEIYNHAFRSTIYYTINLPDDDTHKFIVWCSFDCLKIEVESLKEAKQLAQTHYENWVIDNFLEK